MNAASVRLREPLGAAADERRVAAPLRIGGSAACEIRVPGVTGDETVRIDLLDGAWIAVGATQGDASLNGEPLQGGVRELRDGDVLALGAARIVVSLPLSDAPLFDVRHLAGNDTLPPLSPARLRAEGDEAGDADIVAANVDFGDTAQGGARVARRARPATRAWAQRWAPWPSALLLVFGLVGRMQRVNVVVEPSDAHVAAAAPLSWHSGATLFVLPGEHRVRATAAGYEPLERALQVRDGQAASLTLRLARKPGVLQIDTGGVAASVLVDGAEAGRAPGELTLAAGERTLTFRAPRHLDVVQVVNVEGRGLRQPLAVTLPPSWGRIAVSAAAPGAGISVDGGPATPLPATLDVPAGVRRLRRPPRARETGRAAWSSRPARPLRSVH